MSGRESKFGDEAWRGDGDVLPGLWLMGSAYAALGPRHGLLV